MSATRKAAIVGGGVIGAGWAARFILHGWHVSVYDPDPQLDAKLSAVLDNARASLPELFDTALPQEGKLELCNSLADAVADADWIQESVPERLPAKHATYAEISSSAPDSVIVGSSTSGFKPSQLRANTGSALNIIVAHPFNPVYLLPLVEIVAAGATEQGVIVSAQQILRDVGMQPLHVRTEIDAHIADRLLEAVWREALWLIKDDVATTAEIDDAIRYGFGLRWAQMGLFETYRIAGGEAGMAHFIDQFGPCLSWPWTKLMDVPELDDKLVNKIAKQSDAQSGHLSIRELERIRDTNLVAMMRALKEQDWAAGQLLNAHERQLSAAANDTEEH